MCGIFGVVAGEDSDMTPALFHYTADHLFRLSESRGKESAGLAILNGGPIQVYKQPVAASMMICSRPYKKLLRNALGNGEPGRKPEMCRSAALIGHSRLVTNGDQEDHRNNQPVIAADMVGIHNGIIVNDRELWDRFPSMQRVCEVDTEVLLTLIRMFLKEGNTLTRAVRHAFRLIKGCASVAVLFRDYNHLLLATNNGALYVCSKPDVGILLFASEEYILRSLLKNRNLKRLLTDCRIAQCRPGHAALVNLADTTVREFIIVDQESHELGIDANRTAKEIVDLSAEPGEHLSSGRIRAYSFVTASTSDDLDLLKRDKEYIERIPRCSKCILPESFPFIEFDARGVCNYCRNHQKIEVLGRDPLEQALARYRRSGRADCLVGISGGRDSCYGLHYIKTILKMNPIAYTYDWGMVTDIARRNISRMCGKLGIEHILVSADINRKRRYVRKNVKAWLRRPNLGMIPLFMAGDKQFYYYANVLKKQTNIPFLIFCAGNEFEQTHFKTGFCGVGAAPKGILTSLPLADKMKLASYYAKQALFNRAYLNSSIFDTIFAYFCSYLMPHDYVYLFHHIYWDEKEIMKVLLEEYDWEVAVDTVATWRIGDGTAAFYNYIYHTVAGFTEYDTFRSNQIREGVIGRIEALSLAARENLPRYESIKWYLSVIGMDIPFNDIIRTINGIPKLYDTGDAA